MRPNNHFYKTYIQKSRIRIKDKCVEKGLFIESIKDFNHLSRAQKKWVIESKCQQSKKGWRKFQGPFTLRHDQLMVKIVH